jgi:[protein-PII] uridylyltransferase
MVKPEILFLATFLHDIGKGIEGNHSLRGAEISMHIGNRMGLSAEERELIEFLVSHHLLMVEIALRRDLHDEQVILRFANEIKNINQLKMLYLLTFADIKAVGPEAWTSWKHTLLMELFLKTSHFFERDAITGPFLKRDEMIKKLQEFLPPEIISEYAEHLPGRYLSCYSVEEIVHHIEMARFIEKEFLLVDWKAEKEMQAKVTVCTKDRYGLFSKITGSMFLNRLNILEAQIHTWENGIALDTFWVEDVTQDIERRLQDFKKDLKEILIGKIPSKDLLSKRNESNGIKRKVIPRVSGEVKINNQDSDFYTIVEVIGEDRLGILYEMTQALTDHGCDIHFARVSTLGNRIVDVFYIQDEWGEKIVERQKIEHLKQTLLRRFLTEKETLS